MTAAAFPSCAVPFVRRMPAHTARTVRSFVGLGRPAAWWAWLMPERRRSRVDGLQVSARAARKSATASGAAGRGASRCSAHQAQKSRQSAAYARTVFGAFAWPRYSRAFSAVSARPAGRAGSWLTVC